MLSSEASLKNTAAVQATHGTVPSFSTAKKEEGSLAAHSMVSFEA